MFKIAIIGEAFGEQEAYYQKPFIGPAGTELDRILADAGIQRDACLLTNVFNLRPEKNDPSSLCCSRDDPEALPGRAALVPGRYLRAEFTSEITRLYAELETARPHLAILLGNTPTWALLGRTGVSKIRGTLSYSSYLPWLKCLPTYHPTAILREYSLRHVTVLDFQKARVEAEFPEIRSPKREIWYEPTLADIELFAEKFIYPSPDLSIDIETVSFPYPQITCVGFAPTITRALVIPFADQRKPGCNYWGTLVEELAAWKWVERLCRLPKRVVGQNFLYDAQYLWMKMGIPVPGMTHDTMLLHHSLFPESEKSLDFLGSVYTNESAWKQERPRGKHTIKRED